MHAAGMLLVGWSLSVALSPDAGERWVFQGEIRPVTISRVLAPIKTFRLYLTVLEADPDRGLEVAWIVEDLVGEPRWYWHQRYGKVQIVGEGQVLGREPAVLAAHRGAARPIPLPLPIWLHELGAGESFEAGGLRYEAEAWEKRNGVRTLRVVVRTDLAIRERLWVVPGEGIVVRRERRVFLGQGVPHRLIITLLERKRLPDNALRGIGEAYDVLEDVAIVGASDRAEPPAPSPERMQALARLAARLAVRVPEADVELRLATQAVRELEEASKQRDQVSQLASRFIGRPAPSFELTDLNGMTFRLDDLRGQVVVLHFWSYGGEPLEAPYGEVGYLDFLNRKLRDRGVRILGIAVTEGLAQPTTRSRAEASVRRFTKFMNLSYPVLLDTAGVIERYGDPRQARAKLPLYVVIRPDGKIAAYHVGLWSSGPDEGLAELATVLEELLETEEKP